MSVSPTPSSSIILFIASSWSSSSGSSWWRRLSPSWSFDCRGGLSNTVLCYLTVHYHCFHRVNFCLYQWRSSVIMLCQYFIIHQHKTIDISSFSLYCALKRFSCPVIYIVHLYNCSAGYYTSWDQDNQITVIGLQPNQTVQNPKKVTQFAMIEWFLTSKSSKFSHYRSWNRKHVIFWLNKWL